MADNRTIATGESSCHPPTVLRDSGVADGVHATVNSMEPARFHATNDPGSTQSRFLELSQGHHSVLPTADDCDPPFWPVDFVPHTDTKSTGNPSSPR